MKPLIGIGSDLVNGKVVSITREGVKVDVKGKSVVLTLAEVETIVFGG
jgi:ribosomal protein S1